MKILRTPDECFDRLKDYPFEPNYTVIKTECGNDIRIHHIDEGPKDGPIILCMHGQPVWSYLYRKMIPLLTNAGLRVIAPDLPGYGKSDKPASRQDYSSQSQVNWMGRWLQLNNFHDLNLFGQDWGGLVGLRVVAELPDRFARVVVSNTGMAARDGISGWLFHNMMKLTVWWNGAITFEELKAAANEALTGNNPSGSQGVSMFTKWIAHSYYAEDMDIVGIIANFGRIKLNDEEKRAYEAPYPTGEYKAGANVWPYLIPSHLQEYKNYWKEVYEKWDKPFLVAFGSEERITLRMKDDFVNRIPNPTVITLGGAGHFVQEEVGPELAQIINDFIEGKKVTDLIE